MPLAAFVSIPPSACVALLLLAVTFAVLIVWANIRARQAKRQTEEFTAQLAAANKQLREQARRIDELASTCDRSQLAREIHDSLGHYLTAISVQLEVARMVHATDPERSLRAVNKAHAGSQQALAAVRRSLSSRDAESSAPLLQRLNGLTELDASMGPAVQFNVLGEPRVLRPEIEHALYRTVQEGLTNVRKHARARTVRVALDYRSPERVEVCIEDDGRGAAMPNGEGHGLSGLRERMNLLGGKVAVGSRQEGGFSLRVEVPA